MAAKVSMLRQLRKYGFSRLTEWELRAGKCKPVVTDWDLVAGWIYAFVTDVRVRYIGIATTVLRSRLDGYSYQLNDSVGRSIREHLGGGGAVEIYGVQRCEVAKADLESEESQLIAAFKPDWSVRS